MQALEEQFPELVQQNIPEELAPLVEALERAREQQGEATGIREALEAEVSCLRSQLPFRVITCGMLSRWACSCLWVDKY